ncbi:MAG: hypothetical protein ABL893_02300 [Hyphomicrobium sp.]
MGRQFVVRQPLLLQTYLSAPSSFTSGDNYRDGQYAKHNHAKRLPRMALDEITECIEYI